MIVDAIVEIPMGSQNKYEVDHITKKIKVFSCKKGNN